jgi:hypothetical protein
MSYLGRCSFRFLAPASRGSLPHHQSDKGDHYRTRKVSGCREFQRYQTRLYEELHVRTRKGRPCKIRCRSVSRRVRDARWQFQRRIPPRSFSLGAETFRRYKHLVTGGNDSPFIRASGSKRVIASAQNWAKGNASVSIHPCSCANKPRAGFSVASETLYPAKVNLIIPEAVGPFRCPHFDSTLIYPASVGATTLWMMGCVPLQ